MKKLLLLCSIIMYCLSANSQSFTASPGTVASGSDVTFTGSGESAVAYFGVVYSYSLSPTSTPVTAALNGSVTTYNLSTLSPTKLKLTFTNNTSTAQSVTVWFACAVNNSVTGSQNTSYQTAVTVTVNPAVTVPTTFYNVAKSGQFTRNNCGAGFSGTTVTYPVVAHTYSSTISQADADQKAINDVNTNGQAYANSHGTCNIIYSSIAYNGNFTRNTCGLHSDAGPAVPYTLAAGAKTSLVSQADANAQALALFNTNGQNNANANGTCIPRNKTYISFSNQAKPGSTITRLRVYNGSTLVYDFNEAQLLAGPEIDPGTYKFVVTTVGPLSNTTTNTGWATLELRTSNAPYQGGYFDNTGTTYTFNNITTASQETVQLFLYFLYA